MTTPAREAVARRAETPDRSSPQPGDSVAVWFDPFLAARMAEAGLATLAEVEDRIQAAGARWWYPVRGLGATKAARIVAWLEAMEDGASGRASVAREAALPVAS